MKKWIPVILIAVSVGIFFVIIDPQYEEVNVLKIKKARNEEFLEKARELERKKNQLQEEFNSISDEDKGQLLKLLPDTVDNVRLILDINNIAETYGVTIRDISIESSDPSSGSGSTGVVNGRVVDETLVNGNGLIGTIVLGFSVNTSYEIFTEILGDLENKLRIVDIRSIGIESSQDSNSYNFLITLDTYWLR